MPRVPRSRSRSYRLARCGGPCFIVTWPAVSGLTVLLPSDGQLGQVLRVQVSVDDQAAFLTGGLARPGSAR